VHRSQWWTDFDVCPCKDMPFGGSVDRPPHLWRSNTPKTCKIFKLSYYQNYCMDSNQILHTSKDHQVCFMDGPETHTHTHTTHTHSHFMTHWILSGTTQVSRYQKKHSPTYTYCRHQSSLICFLHLLRSVTSSLFNLRA